MKSGDYMGKTKTHEEFVDQLYAINKNITILSKYINSNNKVKCKCNICNYVWIASPSKLLIGRSCPMCAKKKVADSRRNNIEQVKEKLIKKNPNVKLIGEYTSCDKPLECECLICGSHWFPTVSNLYAGKGCPKCAINFIKEKNNLKQLDALKKIKKEIAHIIVNSSPLKDNEYFFKCKKCGYRWKTTPVNVYKKKKCPNCEGIRLNRRGLSNADFINKLKQVTNDVEPLENYKGISIKIKCKCLKCGNIWETTPNRLLSKHLCPECGKKLIGIRLTKSNDDFVNELQSLNQNIIPLEEYKGANIKIQFKCKKCNNVWMAIPHSILRGSGCPECAKKIISNIRKKTHEHFCTELKRIQPDIVLLEKYEKSNIPIKCLCNNCNHTWKVRPDDLLNGKGCPNCAGFSGTSFVEQLIYLALTTVLDKDKVLNRNKKMLGIELDIYVPSLNFAVEFGSWFWHKNKVKNDKRKIDICRKNGIELVTIYDSCDIDTPPFNNNCYIIKENLSEQKNYEILKNLIIKIMKQYNLKTNIFVQKYDELVIEAKRLSRRRGTERFKEELKAVNPNIEIIGEFQRVHEKIKCKCKKCDYIWDGIPSGLLRGSGCPKCGGNWRKTHEEYVEQVKNINDKIRIIGKYIKDDDKIECECLTCGFKWFPIAGSLIQGHGCPKCAKKRMAKQFARSHEQFVKELKQKNSSIKVIGEYINARTKIECECLICHHIWFANPDCLINRGSGCPKCKKTKK